MLFKDYHIPYIREGTKTVTRRVWAKGHSRPVPGSVHMAASASMVPAEASYDSPLFLEQSACTCFIRIDEDYGRRADREPLGAMTDADARLEGPYETVAEFREGWERVHGVGSWDPDLVVDVVPFEYVGRTPPED